MKKLIAIGLLTACVQVAPLQALEAPSQKKWKANAAQKHSQSISVPSRPNKYQAQRPVSKPVHKPVHRPVRRPVRRPTLAAYSRPDSLHQAGFQIEKLEQRQRGLERELHHAKRRHANRSEIRRLDDALFRVTRHLQSAKRDYRHFLKIKLGNRQFTQLIKHAAWLSAGHRN